MQLPISSRPWKWRLSSTWRTGDWRARTCVRAATTRRWRSLRTMAPITLVFTKPASSATPTLSPGMFAEARRILDELHAKIDRGEYVAPIDGSVMHIGLGEYDEALTWLDQVADDRGSRIFLCDPIFDPFRNHPRFNRIRERLGLAGTNVTS